MARQLNHYADEELVRISANFHGVVLNILNEIATDRGITRTQLFYVIIKNWLLEQGYTSEARSIPAPPREGRPGILDDPGVDEY